MRCSSSLVPTMGGAPPMGSCWTIHDRSRNTVTISRWSYSSGWNRLMAPASLIRCEPVKMFPSRQSVKSWPCSVQVIRCSSQKASAMVSGIRGSFGVSGWGFGVLGWGWTPTACRQGMPPAGGFCPWSGE